MGSLTRVNERDASDVLKDTYNFWGNSHRLIAPITAFGAIETLADFALEHFYSSGGNI